MRQLALLLCLLAGCVAQRTPPTAPTRPTAIAEGEVRAAARALLTAYDHGDEARFRAGLGETFALFESKRLASPTMLITRMRERRARGAPAVLRSFTEEHIRASPEAAVYLGQTTEHAPAEPDHPARDYEGWNTLVFARDVRGALRAVHWAWERAGSAGTRELWNEEFSAGAAVVAEPNQTLVDAVHGVRPGSALDLGTGEGRNALFLAAHGWQVTGVDISDVGLGLAREAAARRKLTLELVRADLEHWDFGRGRWDLVTMIYMGSDEAMIRRAQASLRPGGLLVLSGYAPAPGGSGPDSAAGGALRGYFGDDFEILRDERVEGIADWGQRRSPLIHFVARKAAAAR